MVNHPLGGSLSPIVLVIYFRGPRFLLFIRPSHILFFRLSTGMAIKKSGQTEEVQFFLKVVVVYYYCSGKKKRYDLRVRSSGSPVWRLMEEGDHPPAPVWTGDSRCAGTGAAIASRPMLPRSTFRGMPLRVREGALCAVHCARHAAGSGPGPAAVLCASSALG